MWPVLQCLSWGTIQTTLVVSHVSQNCSDLTCLSNLFHCCARVRCWVKLTVSAGNWRWWAALCKVVNLRGKKKQKRSFCLGPVFHCCDISLLALLQRQEENSATKTHCFSLDTLYSCTSVMFTGKIPYNKQSWQQARTHNHTEKGLVLHSPQKRLQHENKRNGLGKDRDSLSVSSSLWIKEYSSLCSCNTMWFWTHYIPCHLIPFLSLYWRFSLSLLLLKPFELLIQWKHSDRPIWGKMTLCCSKSIALPEVSGRLS